MEQFNQAIRTSVRSVVIFSGSVAKFMVPQLSQSASIKKRLKVVIFCFKVDFHKEWSKEYEIVKGVCSKFDELKDHVEELASRFASDS